MKKLIALLLVLCMVVGLVACGKKPVDDPNGTGSTGSTGGSANNGGSGDKTQMGGGIISTDGYTGGTLSNTGGDGLGGKGDATITSNDDLINPDFKGKTLQVYGYSSAEFDYIEDMGKGSFIWMVRAAIDEWAALNGVTVVFEGDYNQSTVLGAINSGEKPDILLGGKTFPNIANMGILRPLTDAEYKQLADTCGEMYLDMLTYKGQSYGFNGPWSGNHLCYYNKTMFEEYGVKTPKEYYMEDNWTWDTYVQCCKEITKDLDGDGKFDTYGTGYFTVLWTPYRWSEAEDGTLTHHHNTDLYKKYLNYYYTGNAEGWLGKWTTCSIASNPRPGMDTSDAEWYNFEHLNKTLVNGDVIETIFPPSPSGNKDEQILTYTSDYYGIFSTCDEPEAALSLLTYILRVGMRYMSEFSCGLYGCNYEGIRGVTAYSLGWRENFQEIVEQRLADFEALEDWDQEMYDKMYQDILNCKPVINGRSYAGMTGMKDDPALELPPASSLPLILAHYDAQVQTYNDLYAN